MSQNYATPLAFKQALEQRLRSQTSDSASLSRTRQLLVFDRFLARASQVLGDAVILKGGLVLELRLERARATKDIDLRLTGSPENVLEKLQSAARVKLRDFLSYEVTADARHPVMTGDGMKYEGMRFQCGSSSVCTTPFSTTCVTESIVRTPYSSSQSSPLVNSSLVETFTPSTRRAIRPCLSSKASSDAS